MKQYISMVYDDWCQCLIRHASPQISESELQRMLEDKFNKLKIKIAEELGIDVLNLRYSNLQNEALTAQQRNLLIEGKIDQIPDMSRIVAKQIPSNVKLTIDFTKLARIADKEKKKQLATFLIEQEKNIVKKIPFLLEAQKFESALVSAVKGGDPNIINKVFSAIIAKESEAKAVKPTAHLL